MLVKKGQLSIETMIIYGVVILVALSVIGALMYFNVFDMGSYLPAKCDTGSPDLKCEEMSYTAAGVINLGVRNVGQKAIAIDTIGIVVTDNEQVHFAAAGTSTPLLAAVGAGGAPTVAGKLVPGEIVQVSIDIGAASNFPGKVLQSTLNTKYQIFDGAVVQTYVGTLRTKAATG